MSICNRILIVSAIAVIAIFVNTKWINAMERDDSKVVKLKGRIVFNSDRYGSGIFILEDGKIRKLNSKDGAVPRFSLEGRRIFFNKANEIYIYDLTSEQFEIIDKITKYRPFDFDISPDNQKIVFASFGEKKSGDPVENLYVVNLDGTMYKQITFFTSPKDWGATGASRPRWSPDGKSIVFSGPSIPNKSSFLDAIYTVNADGTDLKRIISGGNLGVVQTPSWSPDSKKIVFQGSVENGEYSSRQIFIANADGSDIMQITKDEHYNHRYPVFSPDGTQIAYSSPRHGDPVFSAELFVINVDGTNEARITPPMKFSKGFGPWQYATDSDPDWHE